MKIDIKSRFSSKNKKITRVISLAVAAVMLLSIVGAALAVGISSEAAWYYTPSVVNKVVKKTKLNKLKSKAAVLVDIDNDMILFDKNSEKKLSMASLTKLMTMLLVMEKVDSKEISFKDKVSITESAYGVEGSQVWLKPGEKFTVKELLEAVAIHSANDAAIALAEYVAGSEMEFVRMMNAEAKKLGLKKTKYVDCNGLADDDKGQYSCAADIVTISKELIKNHPKILDFTSILRKDFRPGSPVKVTLDNTNRMIFYYKGTVGLKTGFTTRAGYNLSIVAKRKGRTLLAVVMGCDDSDVRFGEATRLLNYGFNEVEVRTVASAGEQVGEVNVIDGAAETVAANVPNDIRLPFSKNNTKEVNKVFTPAEGVKAPVSQGSVIGSVQFVQGKKVVATVDAVAAGDVEEIGFFASIWRWFINLF